MATVTRTAIIDDVDGSDADVTVTISVDGKRYQVDLSKANYAEWIAPLVKVARASRNAQAKKAAGKRAPAAKRVSKATTYSRLSAKDQGAVRAYLKRPRGRIADEAVKAWKAAGKPKG